MKHIKRNLQLTLAAVLAVSVVAAIPVAAVPAEVKAQVAPAESTDDSSSESVKPTGEASELRKRAKQLLVEERQAKKTERKAEAKLKACEARETNLNKKVTNFGKHSQRHYDRLDKTYAKLKAFQAERKLDADQYEALVKVADEKQTAAKEAVAALKAVAIDIDCTTGDPAESVATVKEAVKSTRVALQEYHISIKNVLVELMTSKSDSKTDSTGGTN